MTKKKNPSDHLPKRAPKKTGKAGIKPLDPVSDFETPTTKEPEEMLAALDKPSSRNTRGKTGRLPGMEDAAVEEIEDEARIYVGLRDDRLDILKHEVESKERLLGLMKAHSKRTYVHDGIRINITTEKEKIKVVVLKEEDEE